MWIVKRSYHFTLLMVRNMLFHLIVQMEGEMSICGCLFSCTYHIDQAQYKFQGNLHDYFVVILVINIII